MLLRDRQNEALGLKSFLKELLGCSVDVGTPSSLRPHLRETVLKEEIRAF